MAYTYDNQGKLVEMQESIPGSIPFDTNNALLLPIAGILFLLN